MKFQLLVVIVTCFLVLPMGGCTQSVKLGKEMSIEEICQGENFHRLSRLEAKDRILFCPMENRVDLYLEWTESKRPMNTALAYDVALSGEQILPSLLENMDLAKREGRYVRMLNLFEIVSSMQYSHSYEICSDRKLMNTLQELVNDFPFADPDPEMVEELGSTEREVMQSVIDSVAEGSGSPCGCIAENEP